MNYGSEIFIDRDRIRLTHTLLEPLSATKGTPLYGLYYPPPVDDPFVSKRDYRQVDIRHDLLFTPVPSAFWSRAVAGRLDIRHAPGTLYQVLSVLRGEGLNILLFRCSRSNHRYATVHFVAALERLDPELSRRSAAGVDGLHLYTKEEARERNALLALADGLGGSQNGKEKPDKEALYEELANFSARMKAECSRVEARVVRRLARADDWPRLAERLRYPPITADSHSYTDFEPKKQSKARPKGFDLKQHLTGIKPSDCLQYDEAFGRRPVSLWYLAYLAYFSAVANCDWRKPPTHPIRAEVMDSNTVRLTDSEALRLRTGLGDELPTVGFATLDTEAYLIRLAVLGRDQLRDFRSAEITYQYSYEIGKGSSMGMLADLLEPLSKEWNLWHAYNIQGRWEKDFEVGKIRLVMDRIEDRLGTDRSEDRPRASTPSNEELESKLRESVGRRDLKINQVEIRPFSSHRIFISIKGVDQLERAKEILELCKEVGAEFGYLRSNVRTVESYTINSVSTEVAHAIRNSSGLIQFLMSDEPTVSLSWVEAEFFYATMLELPTVRIVDPRFRSEARSFQDKAPIVLPEFASSARVRQAIHRAFQQLDEKIRFG